MHPCPVCTLTHAGPSGAIEIRDPDDEIIGCGGVFHVERMTQRNVWIGFTQPDGERVTLNLYSKRRIRMYVQDERP